jgi:hypothetical protein
LNGEIEENHEEPQPGKHVLAEIRSHPLPNTSQKQLLSQFAREEYQTAYTGKAIV